MLTDMLAVPGSAWRPATVAASYRWRSMGSCTSGSTWTRCSRWCPGSSSRVLSPVAQLGGEHGAEPLACCADLARAAPAGSTVLLKPSRRRLEDMERVISSSPRRLAGPWSTAAAPPPAAARPPAGRPRSPAGGGAAFADDPWTPRLGL
ncbi:unnamed protein product [Prorocentrum cordatum]|uniref:Uncharacterized protein n=1 Tax=Prorocentrum cordatum TaxID=2364126 RepID=A0ABN9WXX7_9DINO|nr:unnamed protein product [Polarella glacialis]